MDQRRARAARRRRALAPLAAAGLLAGLAACSTPAGGGTTTAAAGVAPEADCLAPEVLGELDLALDQSLAARASHAPAPAAGRVPDDFVPTAVLECQVGGQMRDGAGTWTAVTATSREGSAADVAALVTVLDGEPATGGAPGGADASCAPEGRALVLWLLDAMNRAVRPSLGGDACGGPPPGLLAALARLPVTAVVDHPVALLPPASR
jgi:hypothetical protein